MFPKYPAVRALHRGQQQRAMMTVSGGSPAAIGMERL